MQASFTGADGARTAERWALIALALAALLPIFFQLRGSIYHSPAAPLLDSGGDLWIVPLPISLPVCLVALLFLGRLRNATHALGFLAAFGGGMLAAAIVAALPSAPGLRKLLLLAQFLIPGVGLVAGAMIASSPHVRLLPRLFLWVLALLIPLQIVLTVAAGNHATTHDMLLFGIYQHRQFVPVVMEAAYVLVLFSLWSTHDRRALALLGVVMAIYGPLSFSLLASVVLLAGLAAFAWTTRTRASAALLLICLACLAATFWTLRGTNEFRSKTEADYVSPYIAQQSDLRPSAREAPDAAAQYGTLPLNVRTRLSDWSTYGRGLLDSPAALLIGHREMLDRKVASSAHNYYLDLAYNFGVIAVLPVFALLAYTLWLLAAHRAQILADPTLVGLALVALFLLLVDNNLKVTLRQPYTGIFAFLLWGLLLGRLRGLAQGADARFGAPARSSA